MKKEFPRLLDLPNKRSLFLFGARNTGKSTYVKKKFGENSRILINLLKADMETRFRRNPDELTDIVMNLPPEITHILIDEIQTEIPKKHCITK